MEPIRINLIIDPNMDSELFMFLSKIRKQHRAHETRKLAKAGLNLYSSGVKNISPIPGEAHKEQPHVENATEKQVTKNGAALKKTKGSNLGNSLEGFSDQFS